MKDVKRLNYSVVVRENEQVYIAHEKLFIDLVKNGNLCRFQGWTLLKNITKFLKYFNEFKKS
jgi:hypothetical protein